MLFPAKTTVPSPFFSILKAPEMGALTVNVPAVELNCPFAVMVIGPDRLLLPDLLLNDPLEPNPEPLMVMGSINAMSPCIPKAAVTLTVVPLAALPNALLWAATSTPPLIVTDPVKSLFPFKITVAAPVFTIPKFPVMALFTCKVPPTPSKFKLLPFTTKDPEKILVPLIPPR